MKVQDIPIKFDKRVITDYKYLLSAEEFNAVVNAVMAILGEEITQEEYDKLLSRNEIVEDKYYYIVETEKTPTDPDNPTPGPDVDPSDPTTTLVLEGTVSGDTLILTNAIVSGDTLIIN